MLYGSAVVVGWLGGWGVEKKSISVYDSAYAIHRSCAVETSYAVLLMDARWQDELNAATSGVLASVGAGGGFWN
jgi:hypothetical protein